MKKQRFLISLLVCMLPLGTQTAAAQENPLSRVYHKITRYVARQQKLPWVQAVERRRHAATPTHEIGIKWDFLSPRPMPSLTRAQQQALAMWQKILGVHDVLSGFILKTSHSEEIENLTDEQTVSLLQFLLNGTTVGTANPHHVPVKTEEFEHYLVRLTLQTDPRQKPLYLIANCYTRELFLSVQPTLPGLPLEPLRTGAFKLR